jgi:hypothetical protein
MDPSGTVVAFGAACEADEHVAALRAERLYAYADQHARL